MNTRFTIEEENIVAIYAEDSRETTLENILAAMPYMDEDMRQLAAAAVNKLQAMTDSEFSEREFILTDEEYWFDEPTKVKDWSSNLRSAIK